MYSRKPIYDIEKVFAITGAKSLDELYDLGYDTRQYIERRKVELNHELELLSKIDKEQAKRESSRAHYSSNDDYEEPFYGSWDPASFDYIGT